MKYDNEKCNQFVDDMEAAGYEVEHYVGRFYWQGPAVRIKSSEYQDVIRATNVRLQEDSKGIGMIVYPVASGKLIDAEDR